MFKSKTEAWYFIKECREENVNTLSIARADGFSAPFNWQAIKKLQKKQNLEGKPNPQSDLLSVIWNGIWNLNPQLSPSLQEERDL